MSKVTVITGASRGIGKGIAKKFAVEGHKLALIARGKEQLEKTASELREKGANVITFAGDVADEKFAAECIDKTVSEFGSVDNLINNAGTSVFSELDESTLDDFKKQVETNVFGVYNFSKAVLRYMKNQESGSIINISSLAGKNGFKGGTMYSATKHAVMGFTKSLMQEVRQNNIRVAAICPGSVYTEFIADRPDGPKDPDKLLSPEDVAEVVAVTVNLPVKALASEIDIRPTNPK